MDLIQKGIEEGIIKLNVDSTRINYIHPSKNYNYKDPEEKVRAETYCKLVLEFGYKPQRFDLEVVMPARVPNNIADIVIYNDDERKDPFIVVECKKPAVSEAEFTQAIEQGFGNAVTIAAHYLWVTSGLNDRYFNVKDYPSGEREANEIPLIPVFGKKEFKEPTFIKGGEGLRALKTLSESELTQLFKKAHDSLWYGGKRNPSEAFDELNKLIFCKIYDEKLTEEDKEDGEPYRFQNYPSDEGNPQVLFDRINSIYEDGRKQDPEVFKDGIRISPTELRTIVGFLAKVNLVDTDLDSKGRAFEVFLRNDIFRGKFGQYFTPRNIVKFIVDVLPITNKSLVLDPSCGSGGFLLYALDKVRQLANQKFPKDTQAVKRYNYWHDFAEKNLFGIEISETIARTSKMNMIIHDDGHTNVIAHDGLENIEKIKEHARKNKSKEYRKFSENSFDFIITNPPFGSKVLSAERSYIGDYDLGKKNYDWIDALLNNQTLSPNRDSQKSEILFVEQCYKFLKNGTGVLAMVIPDSILVNGTQQYVRDWISEHFKILSVVSLPQLAFQATGAGVKSSILFAQKYDLKTTQSLKNQRLKLQTELFEKDEFGGQIQKLLEEKDYTLKKGDSVIQKLNDDLANYIESLRNQVDLNSKNKEYSKDQLKKIIKDLKDLEKTAIRKTKSEIKKHKDSDTFKIWKKQKTDEYNEKISIVKESLDEKYIAVLREQFENYKVYLASPEEIGYDATGREYGENELNHIRQNLALYIKSNIEFDTTSINSFRLVGGLDSNRYYLLNWDNFKYRFDPYFYKPEFLELEKFIESSNIKFEKLKRVSSSIFSGITPKSKGDSYAEEGEGIPFIRSGDYTSQNTIDFDAVINITDEIHNTKMKGSKLRKNDLLIAIVGATIGKVGVYNYDNEANINQAICAVRFKSDVNPFFVQAFLLTEIGQKQIDRLKRPVARANINLSEIGELRIPIIQSDNQLAIIKFLNDAFDKYFELIESANKTLKEAKKEVERMILTE